MSDITPEPIEVERMAALDRVRLPVQTLAEAIPHLRRPFTPEAIRFKVQSVWKRQDGTPSGCLIVAYIDQRLVSERLNRVIPDKWSARYEFIQGSKLAWCHLTVDGVTRTDVGESPKGISKDLISDALKRAAVPFGVGVSCYALPQIKLNMDDSERLRIAGKADKRTLVLTEHGMNKLRAGYATWLEEHGVPRFGPPLDHGDVVGATIEEDVPEEETGLGAGEGNGSEPGWHGVSLEHATAVESLLERAALLNFPGLADRATVQMRLNGQSAGAVQEWIDAAAEQLAAVQPPVGEVEDAEVVGGEKS